MPPKKSKTPAEAPSPKKRARPAARPVAAAPTLRSSPRKEKPSTRKTSLANPTPTKVTKKTASPAKPSPSKVAKKTASTMTSTRKASTASPKKSQPSRHARVAAADIDINNTDEVGDAYYESVPPPSPRKPSTASVRSRSKSPAKKRTAADPDEQFEAGLREQDQSEQPTVPDIGYDSVITDRPGKFARTPEKYATSRRRKAVTVEPRANKLPEGRGSVVSWANPVDISVPDKNGNEGKTRKNPFFEYMPAKEVWHRRMPPYFPFGETPFMEAMISGQINEDLNRTHPEPEKEKPGVFNRLTNAAQSLISGSGKSSPTKPDAPRKEAPLRLPTTWNLPKVSDDQVQSAIDALTASKKRKAGAQERFSRAKRPARAKA